MHCSGYDHSLSVEPLTAVHVAVKVATPEAAKPSSHSTVTVSVVTPLVLVALRFTTTAPQLEAKHIKKRSEKGQLVDIELQTRDNQ